MKDAGMGGLLIGLLGYGVHAGDGKLLHNEKKQNSMLVTYHAPSSCKLQVIRTN